MPPARLGGWLREGEFLREPTLPRRLVRYYTKATKGVLWEFVCGSQKVRQGAAEFEEAISRTSRLDELISLSEQWRCGTKGRKKRPLAQINQA